MNRLLTLVVNCVIIYWAESVAATQCPPNQEYVMSFGGFRASCAVPEKPPLIADAYMAHKRCLCKKGYVFETRENEKCIPLTHCPRDCKPNAEYVISWSGFRPTCNQLQPPEGWKTTLKPYWTCICKRGYVYDHRSDPNCIPITSCKTR